MRLSSVEKVEKKAKLISAIIRRTKKVPVNIIKNIADAVNLNIQYKIVVLNNAKEFAKKVTLKHREMEHSWAGRECYKQEGRVIIGNGLKFGKEYFYEYYDNGNLSDTIDTYEEPDFNIDEIYAVQIDTIDYSNYNSNYWNIEKHELVIYIPDRNPYVIDEVTQKIIDLVGIKA